MIFFGVSVVMVIWLVLSFIELPMENPNRFDAVKYWQDKERKWGQK